MQIPYALPHAARAVLIIGTLTFLALSSQLALFWNIRVQKPLDAHGAFNNTSLKPAQHVSNSGKSGRVYMHYGHGAMEHGVSLDGFFNDAMRIHLEYDAIHGYPSFVLRSDLYDGVWGKVAYLATIIAEQMAKPRDQRLEWLCWTDRDIIIMNPLIPMSIFLPPHDFPSTDLLVARDFNALNAGIFLIRVSQWSYRFMCEIVAFRSYNPYVGLVWHEQSAMIALIEQHPEYLDEGVVRYVPQNWFNAYTGPRDSETGLYSPDDKDYNYTRHGGAGVFMLHFAGPDTKPKMALYLKIAKQHNRSWEIPLEQTGYPREIRRFWEKERERTGSGAYSD